MTPRPLPAPLESRDCSSSVECTFEKGEFHPSTIYSIFMVHIVLLMSRTLDNGGEIYFEGHLYLYALGRLALLCCCHSNRTMVEQPILL